ncbi:MAG TPA: ATP-dependent RecD-like DNA helicase [Clostridiaceae bacterium]|nr:ATP-dependent RecD-like DNA helicase [Clostridiaceae bacterium]
MDEKITLEGTIEEVIFRNETNGYVVCDIRCNRRLITTVGYMPFINEGETVKVTGRWVTHPDYGEQLKVEFYEKKLPQTVDAMERYLASGIIKGVGPATAKKIVEKFGDKAIDIVQFNPEKLSEIKGISLEKALKIGQAFNEQRELKNVVMFLQEYGISPSYSAKIYKVFGDRTIEEIKKNPYRLADEIFGIGFKTADRIAKNLGIEPTSKYRICSGIKYVLSQAAAAGHTFLTSEMLLNYTAKLLEINIENIDDALISLVMDRAVYIENCEDCRRVYLSSFYNAEMNVSRKLLELASLSLKYDIDGFNDRIERMQQEDGIILADMQKEAIKAAMTSGVLVITGGPGTGKTTIIKTIIRLLGAEGNRIALAAPTGRAAKRMTEATGYEAKTIHRLLEIGYVGEDEELVFQKNADDPVEADVVIIDEMSMMDILLMNHLLKALRPGTRLILVGDVNQLPSVGPGNVLKDIITSKLIKTVRLTEIFRQAQKSMIVLNAHRVNRGEAPLMNVKDGDFYFISRNTGSSIVNTIVELCTKRLPATYGYDPMKHIQVLTPMKKGLTGVKNLNTELQKALNPPGKAKSEKVFRDCIFREGDRVMQIKNNYNLRWIKSSDLNCDGTGVFNGDTGTIQYIDVEEQVLTVLFEDERIVEYDFSILDELELAYAVTVHKSQGSEFPVVIMPAFAGPSMLMTRNLLYTAITRAKELVVLVGDADVVIEMVNNDRETLRYSGLAEKLQRLGAEFWQDGR